MKVTTTKASPALLGFLGKGNKPIEIPWPQEEDTQTAIAVQPEPASVIEAPVAVAVQVAEVVEAVAVELAVAPASLEITEPLTVPEISPAVESIPETTPVVSMTAEPVSVAIEPVLLLAAPPMMEPTPVEQVEQTVAADQAAATEAPVPPPVVEAVLPEQEAPLLPIEVAAPAEVAPPAVGETRTEEQSRAQAPKAPTIQQLLESNGWISRLCQELIESEKRLLENGADRSFRPGGASQDPIKAMWQRFRQNGQREKFLAEVAKESRRCSSTELAAEIPRNQLVELKQTFLKAIRHIREPYRSTVFRHFCEGLSIAELVGRQEVSGWIVRERLIAGLDLLDRTLEEELGKERIRSYVLLSKVGKN